MRRLLTLALATALMAALAVPAAAAQPKFAQKSGATIVETALAVSGPDWDLSNPTSNFDDNPGDFDILINALLATGAVGLFDGDTDWTVFAPTDQAFLDLASALAGSTITDEGVAFTTIAGAVGVDGVLSVLAYHLTEGVRNSVSVTRAKQVTMLDGNTISARGGFVDGIGSDANFVAVDLRVADGIIHIIDTVLLPF
jgi:uncharacterized surface protein with fasciclin (FAS1) repeats